MIFPGIEIGNPPENILEESREISGNRIADGCDDQPFQPVFSMIMHAPQFPALADMKRLGCVVISPGNPSDAALGEVVDLVQGVLKPCLLD